MPTPGYTIPDGNDIATLDAAVINPLALTVNCGTTIALPNCPTFAFTVASVALDIGLPVVPDNVKSEPVTEIEPDGIDTDTLDTEVISPLPLTVNCAMLAASPNIPTLAFTVVSVVAFPIEVTSPVKFALVITFAAMVAEAAEPVIFPTIGAVTVSPVKVPTEVIVVCAG